MFETKRDFYDRRSVKDRRRKIKLAYFAYKGSERRNLKERRSEAERRKDWVRVSRWSSVCLRQIKLSKFIG